MKKEVKKKLKKTVYRDGNMKVWLYIGEGCQVGNDCANSGDNCFVGRDCGYGNDC